jgi:hypothetical protein
MNDIAFELARLHVLKGAEFVYQLKMLAQLKIFKPVENEKDIFAAEASHHEDFDSLLDAARKAVELGYNTITFSHCFSTAEKKPNFCQFLRITDENLLIFAA